MDCFVTIAADVDRLVHLLTREVLLEPLVSMASTWNQVMFGRAPLGDPVAEIASISSFAKRGHHLVVASTQRRPTAASRTSVDARRR